MATLDTTIDRGEAQRAAVRPPTGRHFARNLDWNLLRAFHEIVQAGGISRAAQRTSRKQPALSMALKRLEDHVGARLCRRGPGGFKLTREGELLAATCESVYGSVAHIPHSVANVATDVHGRVRIQLISNLVDRRIDDAIQSFHRAHELVELFISVATWDVIQRSVLRNEVEIGIAPTHHQDSDLRYELLFQEVYRPYCGRPHPLFGVTANHPADLAAYPFILTGADEPHQQTKFRQRYGPGPPRRRPLRAPRGGAPDDRPRPRPLLPARGVRRARHGKRPTASGVGGGQQPVVRDLRHFQSPGAASPGARPAVAAFPQRHARGVTRVSRVAGPGN